MTPVTGDEQGRIDALKRLIGIAYAAHGTARRVADFLLSWHCASENGGFDIYDLGNVEDQIASDMFTCMLLIREKRCYPGDFAGGIFHNDIEAIWKLWREKGRKRRKKQ